jgi:hypothetical protein
MEQVPSIFTLVISIKVTGRMESDREMEHITTGRTISITSCRNVHRSLFYYVVLYPMSIRFHHIAADSRC